MEGDDGSRKYPEALRCRSVLESYKRVKDVQLWNDRIIWISRTVILGNGKRVGCQENVMFRDCRRFDGFSSLRVKTMRGRERKV